MNSKRMLTILVFLWVLAINGVSSAQTLMYVPFDNRPVSLEYVTDTVEKGGFDILVPPEAFLANRTKSADPEFLWDWVFANVNQVDSIVVSADALIYGGLVGSRTHDLNDEVLLARAKNFEKLKKMNPSARIYVFSTIMRSPHASSGGVEPPYYETYGPAIFQINALNDKRELQGLTNVEEIEYRYLTYNVPPEVLSDWLARREKNFKINVELIREAKKDTFAYLLMGRDDCSPFSRSHQESRWLAKEAAGLPASKYLSFPGADQLGLVLLTRAANDLRFKIPSVAIKYTRGAGDKTIPSYEDVPVGETVRNHLIASGCLLLNSEKMADIILAVNTPVNGQTKEAGGGANPADANRLSTNELVKDIQAYLAANKKVAVADISFANGADNSLMHELNKNKLLPKLEAYSGWNTASNTIGYTIGQTVFAQKMTAENKKSLLVIRLLDDWSYQANIRRGLLKDVLLPREHSDVALNDITPELITETEKQMNSFAQQNLSWYPINKIEVTYPWNRMFEVGIKVQ